MKNRKMARAMTEYMRKVNPELASALTDERDEVSGSICSGIFNSLADLAHVCVM